MLLNPKPATRMGQTMRTAIFGASGSGKTLYALEIAKVLTNGDMKRVLVVDTENESSGLYSDKYQFMIQPWEGDYDPLVLAELIRQADNSPDFDVIIIDGLTPFWNGKGGMLDLVEKYAPKGNTQAGWGKASNHETEMKEQILATKSHLIVTMRAKAISQDDPDPSLREIGMKPDQRGTIFYEFNTGIYIHKDHSSQITKTRCDAIDENAKFSAQDGAQAYAEIEAAWLADNTAYADPQDVAELVSKFEEISDQKIMDDMPSKRKMAKEKFVAKYGAPDKLDVEVIKDANKYVDELVKEYTKDDPFEVTEEEPEEVEA